MYAEQPDDPRIVFYLARSYFDFGRYEEAIELFDKRLRMGGWDEELFISQYVKGLAHIQLGQYGEGRLALLNAYLRRPSRAEPLYMMAKSMLPPEEDILFIEPRCYGPET
jgi:tetratricopeptide (TPR) repeat protein